MNNSDNQLYGIIQKYSPRNLVWHATELSALKTKLKSWASNCYMEIIESGSIAKGTAISLSSDVDYVVSLTSNCNENKGGLRSIYDSLYNTLASSYKNIRQQNVSVRISLPGSTLLSPGLEIDVTPARKLSGNTNNHTLWVSKLSTWKQTNIKKHIDDISKSNRQNEIKLLKIWRELNHLDFPSIYLEYLLVGNILKHKPVGLDYLASNFNHSLLELAKQDGNPLLSRVVDPANSNNILSDLLTTEEKNKIFRAARNSICKKYWEEVVA